jgi:hypothetical protein
MTKFIDARSGVLIFLFTILLLLILGLLVDRLEIANIASGLIIGFGLQYSFFYSLRWCGLLTDVDLVFLPQDASLDEAESDDEADLFDLPDDNIISPLVSWARQRSPFSKARMPLGWMIILVALTACEQHKKEIDGFDYDYQKSRIPVLLAVTEGHAKWRGFAAELAISSGTGYGPHSTVIALSICCGMLGGAFLQYFVLLVGKSHQCINTFWIALMIPGSKHSAAFGLVMRRRQFILQSKERMASTRVVNEIRFSELLADQALKERQIAAASSIDELCQARLLKLAEEELTAIVTSSEEGARSLEKGFEASKKQSYVMILCPHCSKRIGSRTGISSKRVTCPYEQCGKVFERCALH